MILDEETYLEHFGVKGMRWGVRKAEEKGGSSSSKGKEPTLREKIGTRQSKIKNAKADLLVARAAKSQVRISEIKKELDALPQGIKTHYKRQGLKQELAYAEKYQKKDTKKAAKIREARLTPTQKKVLIGAAVVGGILLASHMQKKGLDPEGIMANIRRIQSERSLGSPFRVNKDLADKTLSADGILSKISKQVNPNYSRAGGQMNCRRSTFAHELRRRGFDVEATTSAVGYGQSETGLLNAVSGETPDFFHRASLSQMVVGGRGLRGRAVADDLRQHSGFTQTLKRAHDLPGLFSKMPDRARGEVVFNEGAFGHSMAWEIIGGKAHIFDSQKAEKYSVTFEGLEKLMNKWGEPSEVAVTRLDDLDLDMKFLSRWVKNT